MQRKVETVVYQTIDYNVKLNNATRIGSKDNYRRSRTIIAMASILNARQKCLRTEFSKKESN